MPEIIGVFFWYMMLRVEPTFLLIICMIYTTDLHLWVIWDGIVLTQAGLKFMIPFFHPSELEILLDTLSLSECKVEETVFDAMPHKRQLLGA